MSSGMFFERTKNWVAEVYENFLHGKNEQGNQRIRANYVQPSYDRNGQRQEVRQPQAMQQPVYQPAPQPVPAQQMTPPMQSVPQMPPAQPAAPQFQGQSQPMQSQPIQQNKGEGSIVQLDTYRNRHQNQMQNHGPQHFQQPQQQPQQFQQAPNIPQPEMQQQPVMTSNGQMVARVMNAKDIRDCRSAISLLRNGDVVIFVIENVNDQAEQRRMVDTLSGACFSLHATITKVSRNGTYLLAPKSLNVMTDPYTHQMNGGSRVPQQNAYRPVYGQQNNYYAPQQGYAPQQNQGFTQRMPIPEPAAPVFYAQPQPQEPQMPQFTAQQVNQGYIPDEARAL